MIVLIYRYYWILVLSFMLSACSPPISDTQTLLNQLPQATQQVLLVSSGLWSQSQASLQRFEKQQGKWQKVANPIAVQLGRNGLAWGRGLHDIQGLSHFKQEGDGKAPAGVFKLGTSFGYADIALTKQSYPYRKAGKRDYYIDDSTSKDYNQWVHLAEPNSNRPKQYWQSYEKMRRNDDLYEWGIEVQHNKSPVVAQAGSAIFMHIWKDQYTSTAGCTAMSKHDIQTLLQWLDQDKQPLLIQVPIEHLKDIKIR